MRKQMQQQQTETRRKQTEEKKDEKESCHNQIIIKDGYKFILLDGLYYKLTKKSYTKEEIEKWCSGRQNASSKMKVYHKEKKIQREKDEKEKITQTNAIFNREISNYPKELQELFVQ